MKLHSLLFALLVLSSAAANATVHTIGVWDGYYKFVPDNISLNLGDTIHWQPYFAVPPTMTHTITSTSIPAGAVPFNELFQPPADTFFQYVPQIAGVYNYQCTPHAASPFNMAGSFEVLPAALSAAGSLAEKQLLAFPNPSAAFLFIPQAQQQRYVLTDATGRSVQAGIFSSFLDLRTLAPGPYLLQLYGEKPRSLRVIKQ